MKLLDKNNLYYFIFSLLACIGIGISFYAVTEYLIYDEVETRLRTERRDFEDYVARNKGVWYTSCYFVENKIDILPVNQINQNHELFIDTLFYDKYSNAEIPFRQLTFYTKLGNKHYRVHLRKSLLESDKLLKYLTTTILFLLTIVFSGMYFLQRKISRKLWNPFYDTLLKIKTFDLSKNKVLNLKDTPIYEFKELNEVLEKMSRKMTNDYKNLKEFTENASHEIQTPLALISVRIEELIQSNSLSEREIYLINDMHNSIVRISRLSNALLLLSKIENNQFPETELIDFNLLIQKKLEEFEEIFSHHEIETQYHAEAAFKIKMNPDLADILLTNLIGNAIKHNLKEGKISISLFAEGFEILNTGQPLNTDPIHLFQRFKKDKHRQDSSGLGLAIVKQICMSYGLNIEYSYKNDYHIIQVKRG